LSVARQARNHPKSALHRALEWNDVKAAEAFRYVQASALIEDDPKFAFLPDSELLGEPG
jgi:hypothetical protein